MIATTEIDAYDAGYTAGYLAGMAAAEVTQQEAAALAARKFYAMEAHQEWLSRFVPAAIDALQVDEYRRSPESSYIPADGDPRYAAAGGAA